MLRSTAARRTRRLPSTSCSSTTQPTSARATTSLLIVENDPHFAHFLFDIAHEHGFKAVVSGRGAVAIQIAREIKPAAITLDINLPDFDGWRVLDRLKDDPATRHIPVQIITTDEETEPRPAHGRDGRADQADQDQGIARRDVRPHEGGSTEPRDRNVLLIVESRRERPQRDRRS